MKPSVAILALALVANAGCSGALRAKATRTRSFPRTWDEGAAPVANAAVSPPIARAEPEAPKAAAAPAPTSTPPAEAPKAAAAPTPAPRPVEAPRPADVPPAAEPPKRAEAPAVPAAARSWVVAVMDVEDANASDRARSIDDGLRRNLADQVRVFIAQQRLRVVERGQQERALREIMTELKAESYGACYDEGCQIPLGKALAATHILRTRVTRFGRRCILNGELVDLKAEVTVAAASGESDCSDESFLGAARSLCTDLIAAIK